MIHSYAYPLTSHQTPWKWRPWCDFYNTQFYFESNQYSLSLCICTFVCLNPRYHLCCLCPEGQPHCCFCNRSWPGAAALVRAQGQGQDVMLLARHTLSASNERLVRDFLGQSSLWIEKPQSLCPVAFAARAFTNSCSKEFQNIRCVLREWYCSPIILDRSIPRYSLKVN